jgi:lysozyme family protein
MAEAAPHKRLFLKSLLALTVGTIWSKSVVAQNRRILGVEIPEEIFKVLPVKPLNYARLADSVITLEKEAQQRDLPTSILGSNKGDPIAAVENGFYQIVLPRLVALIDRSEVIDPDFADKAGSLLAELHGSQHEIPEMLRLSPAKYPQTLPQAGKKSPLDIAMKDLGLPSFITPQSGNDGTNRPEIQTAPASDDPIIVFPDGPDTSPAPDAPPPNAEKPVGAPDVPDDTSDDSKSLPDDGPPQVLSRKKDYASLAPEYLRQWRSLTIRPAFQQTAAWHLSMVRKSKARYEAVARAVDVPWHFIAVIHALESSFNFRAHLHNGDFPLTARTRQVPAGRPSTWLPPSDWESSARDALRLLGFTGLKDWSLERTIHRLEAYNGMGYRGLGVPSPYLWSFSNHYDRGKFVADGRFSARAKSQQCGTVVMLKMLDDAGEIKLVPAA